LPGHFARYPVIFLTFKDVKQRDFAAAMASIARLICDEVERHAPEIPGSGSSRALLREIIAGAKDQGCSKNPSKA